MSADCQLLPVLPMVHVYMRLMPAQAVYMHVHHTRPSAMTAMSG